MSTLNLNIKEKLKKKVPRKGGTFMKEWMIGYMNSISSDFMKQAEECRS